MESIKAQERVGIQKIEPESVRLENRQQLKVIPAFDTSNAPVYQGVSLETEIQINNPFENPFKSF